MGPRTITDFISAVLVALVPLASALIAAAVAWVAKWVVAHVKSATVRADIASAVLFCQQKIPSKDARYQEAADRIHAFWPALPEGQLQTLIEAAVASFKLTNPDWENLPPAPTPQAPQPAGRMVAPTSELVKTQLQQMTDRAEATVAAARPAEPQGNLIDTKVIRLPVGTMTITTHLEPASTSINAGAPQETTPAAPTPQGV